MRRLGSALIGLGVADRVGAQVLPAMVAGPFDPRPDPEWRVPNLPALAALARRQADAVARVLDAGNLPVVLGGDDSVLLGCLLAMRRTGPCGLLFLDGHTDFWDPRKGSGELSDSDLWIATGGGPPELADIEGLGPLVSPDRCVVYGHRDRDEQLASGSDDIYDTPSLVRGLAELRAAGTRDAGTHAAAFLRDVGPRRVWLHLDADCLDDDQMPAVDWRLPGGLTPAEVRDLLGPALRSGLIAGLDVTIYNPDLDTAELAAGRVLADLIVDIVRDLVATPAPRSSTGPARTSGAATWSSAVQE